MPKRLLGLGAIGLLATACSTAAPTVGGATLGPGAGSTPGTGGGAATASTGGGGGAGSGAVGGGGTGAVAEAASRLTDVCTVMPRDAVLALVPDAGAPNLDAAYRQCTMSNGTTAVQLTISGGFGEPDPPNPAESVGGLGEKAWLQEQTVDDAYLVIFLGVADAGSYQTMYVEFAGHDGKAHRDDAIGIARAAIQALQ